MKKPLPGFTLCLCEHEELRHLYEARIGRTVCDGPDCRCVRFVEPVIGRRRPRFTGREDMYAV